MRRLAYGALVLIAMSLMITGTAKAGTYYISTSGSDANSGTSESSPWAHLPGMATWTGTYKPAAGDNFVLRGCDDWGNSNFPLTWTWSGTSTNPITITGTGPDTSYTAWYNTTNCPSGWNRAIFDAQSQNVGPGCTNAGWMVTFSGATYVDMNWVEQRGLYWNNNQQNTCYGTVGYIHSSGSDYISVKNAYLHDWTHGTSAGTTDVGGTGFVGGSCVHCNFSYSIIDNSDSPDGQSCLTSSHAHCSGGGVTLWNVDHDVVYADVEAFLTDASSGNTQTIAFNNISGINESFTDVSQGSNQPHPNMIETVGGGTFYIHDNWIHNNGCGEGGQLGNPGEVDYVWNNLWDMTATSFSSGCANGPQMPQSSSGTNTWSLYFWNNTVIWGSGIIAFGAHSTAIGNEYLVNNYGITNSGFSGTMSPSGVSLIENTVAQPSLSTANSQGFSSGSAPFPWAPTTSNCNGISANCPTSVGANLIAALWLPSIFTATDLGAICSEQTVSGVLQVACTPRATARPVGNWDAGAYQFAAASSGPPSSTGTLSTSVR